MTMLSTTGKLGAVRRPLNRSTPNKQAGLYCGSRRAAVAEISSAEVDPLLDLAAKKTDNLLESS